MIDRRRLMQLAEGKSAAFEITDAIKRIGDTKTVTWTKVGSGKSTTLEHPAFGERSCELLVKELMREGWMKQPDTAPSGRLSWKLIKGKNFVRIVGPTASMPAGVVMGTY